MPLLSASATTGRGGMLGNEDGMTSHRCLFAVIFWKLRRDSRIHKLKSMRFDGFNTFGGDVIAVFWGQLKFRSEFGFCEGGEPAQNDWIMRIHTLPVLLLVFSQGSP